MVIIIPQLYTTVTLDPGSFVIVLKYVQLLFLCAW